MCNKPCRQINKLRCFLGWAITITSISCLVACGHTATIVGQRCGTIHKEPNASVAGDANASTCFYEAYAKCQAATLIYIDQGIDTEATHTLTIQKQGSRCIVADDLVNMVNNREFDGNYQCEAVVYNGGQLSIQSCTQEGDIGIPPLHT